MVRRGLKLAHVVTAVLSLSRPSGVTRSQIIQFCVRRYQTSYNTRTFNRVLEEAIDEGFLVCFNRRYRLARSNNSIIWALRDTNRRSKRGKREKKQRKKSRPRKYSYRSGLHKSWHKNNRTMKNARQKVDKSRARKNPRNGKTLKRRRSAVSSGRSNSRENKRKTRRKASRKSKMPERRPRSRRKVPRQASYRSETRGRSMSRRKVPSQASYRSETRGRSMSRRKVQRQASYRSETRGRSMSRRKVPRQASYRSETRGRSRSCRKITRRTSHNSSMSSRRSSESSGSGEGFGRLRATYRDRMKQMRNSMHHAQSWDRITHNMFRGQAENKHLHKNARLVEKILTRPHAKSWDDMSRRLSKVKQTNYQLDDNRHSLGRGSRSQNSGQGDSESPDGSQALHPSRGRSKRQ